MNFEWKLSVRRHFVYRRTRIMVMPCNFRSYNSTTGLMVTWRVKQLRYRLCYDITLHSPEKHSMHLQKVFIQAMFAFSVYSDRRSFHRFWTSFQLDFQLVCILVCEWIEMLNLHYPFDAITLFFMITVNLTLSKSF